MIGLVQLFGTVNRYNHIAIQFSLLECFVLSAIVLCECTEFVMYICMYLSVGALVEVSAIRVGLSSCSHGCSGPVWLPSQVL